MYSCKEMLEELSLYLDDEVAAEIRKEIENHLTGCATCRVLFDSSRKTLKIVTDSRAFELPEELSARMMKRLMDKLRSRGKPQPPRGTGQ